MRRLVVAKDRQRPHLALVTHGKFRAQLTRAWIPIEHNVIGGVLWGSACVLLGYFAAHSISTITHALGLTSGAIVVFIAGGLIWAWHRRSRDD